MQKSASGTRVSRRRLTRVNPLFGMQKTHLASDTPREPDALLCIWHAGESSTTHPRGRCRKVHLGASGPTPPVQVSQMRFSASGSRGRMKRTPPHLSSGVCPLSLRVPQIRTKINVKTKTQTKVKKASGDENRTNKNLCQNKNKTKFKMKTNPKNKNPKPKQTHKRMRKHKTICFVNSHFKTKLSKPCVCAMPSCTREPAAHNTPQWKSGTQQRKSGTPASFLKRTNNGLRLKLGGKAQQGETDS